MGIGHLRRIINQVMSNVQGVVFSLRAMGRLCLAGAASPRPRIAQEFFADVSRDPAHMPHQGRLQKPSSGSPCPNSETDGQDIASFLLPLKRC